MIERFVPAAGGVALVVAILVSFALDFANLAQGGAIDLRNRVTGVRLIEAGIDPYTYKWHEGDEPRYCDPYNNPRLPVSKTTASPALLLAEAPLAWMPYRVGQVLWFLAQWALLVGTGALFFRACATTWQRWAIAILMTGFTYTAAWRLHAERGQAYALLAFLFAAWLTTTSGRARPGGFIAGFCAGLLAALRPSFLLLFPFLALHRRGQLAGAAAGLLLGAALPMLFLVPAWPDYFSAMRTNASLYLEGFDPPPGPQVYPAKIEGVPTDILGHAVSISYADFSVLALLRAIGADAFPAWPVLLAVLVPYGLWLVFSRSKPAALLLPAVAAWCFVADLFLPAYRNTYNDVLILDLAGIALVMAATVPWLLAPCAAAVIVGWGVYAASPEQPWLINLPSALFTLAAVLLILATAGADRRRIAPGLPSTRPGRAAFK